MASSTPCARKPLIGGNFKCNGTKAEMAALVSEFNKGEKCSHADVLIIPAALHLQCIANTLRKDFNIGVQNIWPGAKAYGAYTGEITPAMGKDSGATWALVGHSERRHVVAHEEDKLLNEKVKAALANGLKVCFCVGEKLEDRDGGNTKDVVIGQLARGVAGLEPKDWANIAIAYEPVWAIGTGRTASPAQAQEVHVWLRAWLTASISPAVGAATRIIYGGSVKPANCDSLWKMGDIDGFLVGGASLKPDFLKIIACSKM